MSVKNKLNAEQAFDLLSNDEIDQMENSSPPHRLIGHPPTLQNCESRSVDNKSNKTIMSGNSEDKSSTSESEYFPSEKSDFSDEVSIPDLSFIDLMLLKS